MAISMLWAALIAYFELVLIMRGVRYIARGGSFEYWLLSQGGDLIPSILILPTFFIAYGGWCMYRRTHYRLAFSAALVACIPCLSPFVLFGIPLGFWALLVLGRRDVQVAFDPETAHTSAASNPA
jgi:hypothetical protein